MTETIRGTVLDDQPILEPTAVCAVCGEPYFPVADDPSPAHPGCAPADPVGWERQSTMFRGGSIPAQGPAADQDPLVNQPGAMRARHWSVCPCCDEVIRVGQLQVLRQVGERRAWVCRSCAARPETPCEVPGPLALDDARQARSSAHSPNNELPRRTA